MNAEIEELILRIPGLSEHESRLLAEEVADGLAHAVPEGSSRRLGDITLRLQVSGEISRKQLVKDIINAISQRIS